MIKLKIYVTKEILERSKNCGFGNKGFPGKSCAIALAIIDIFPSANVGSYEFWPIWDWSDDNFYQPKGFGSIELPDEAIEFIKQFDFSTVTDRENMMPVTFEIKIPDNVIGQINIEEIRPLLINHPTLELITQ